MPNRIVRWTVPLSEPEISGNEWKYVRECINSGWVSSAGLYVEKFEREVQKYLGCRHAIAVINGTSALHVSLIACGIGPGDEVIVPAVTFVAPVNAVRYCGAYPIFMDCARSDLGLDVVKVAEFMRKESVKHSNGLMYNKKTGKRIKAIIPVHVFGHPVNMDPIIDLAQKYHLYIIEDATESLGSEYKGRRVGALGVAGCLSFNGNKIVTTGGGGMVVTNNDGFAFRVRHLSTQAKKNPLLYDHDQIGYNYRLTNIQAALGVAQMERLTEFVQIKRKNAGLYRKLLSGLQVEFLEEPTWAKSNFWLYAIKVSEKHQRKLLNLLRSKGIEARPLWKPIHTLPMYHDCQVYAISNATKAWREYLNIPSGVKLSHYDIEHVVKIIMDYFGKKS